MAAFTHDLPAMAAEIDEETQLLFVANPNNPTGTMVGEAELDALIESVPDSVLVVIDEAYIELLDEGAQPDTLKWIRRGRKNVVITRTFSKTYGLAGLRLGYAIAHPEVIQLMNKVRQPFNVNAMAQRAALAALEDADHVQRTRDLVSAENEFLSRAFEAMGLDTVPSHANFLLVKVGPGRTVFEALQKKSVIVRPMDGYGLPEYVRITFGLREQNEAVVKALEELREEGVVA
jgi:histidinol-phosphate aminotransferase